MGVGSSGALGSNEVSCPGALLSLGEARLSLVVCLLLQRENVSSWGAEVAVPSGSRHGSW